jgi:hypothetical protein
LRGKSSKVPAGIRKRGEEKRKREDASRMERADALMKKEGCDGRERIE